MTALLQDAYKAYAEVNPARLHRAHWVMDLTSYKAIRGAFGPDDDTPPDEWVPGPDDTMFGLPITVTADGGQPHLVDDYDPAMTPEIAQALSRAGSYVMGGMSHLGALGLAAFEMTDDLEERR